MLTKTDLSAIQKMLNSSTKEIKTDIAGLKKSVSNIEVGQRKHSEQIGDLSNKTGTLTTKIDNLSRDMKRGFGEVIDLISPAFTGHERILGKHEVRITNLEKTSPQN